ncbi:MAG: hypothetical protein ACLQBC_19440, partial [Syntrophales bacterium]
MSETPSGFIQKGNAVAEVKMTGDATKVTLAEGLKTVTSESHVVKVARQDESIAEADSLIARARLLPSVNASGSYTSLANQPADLYLGQAIPISDRYYKSYGINISRADERVVIARGGRGGRGNAQFATSTHQAPREHEDGRPGEER